MKLKNILILFILIYFFCVELIIGRTIRQVKANKYLIDKGKKYGAEYLIDNNINTCWAYRIKKNIKKEKVKITFYLIVATNIKTISIVNGYAKSSNLYRKNARAKEIELIYKYGDKEVYRKKYKIKDVYDIQTLKTGEEVKVDRVELRILKVYKGNRWNDVCISEVFFNNKYAATTLYYVERIANGILQNNRDKIALKKFLSFINLINSDRNRCFEPGQISDLHIYNVETKIQILFEISINPIRGVSCEEYFDDEFRGFLWDGNTSEKVFAGIIKSLKYIGYNNWRAALEIFDFIVPTYYEGIQYKEIRNFSKINYKKTLKRIEEILDAYKKYTKNQNIISLINKRSEINGEK